MKQANYRNDIKLKKRKALYDYTVPRIDLDKEIFNLIDLNKHQSVLDVGCGNGDLLIRLRKEEKFTGKLVGIDISAGILKGGIEQNKQENLDIDFRVGNAEELNFPNNNFDVIISKHVLHHVSNVKRAVDESYRCLKPSGLYIVALNSKKNKPKLIELEKFVEEKWGVKIERASERLSIEDIKPSLSKFSKTELKLFGNLIELRDSKPYVNYFDSLKDFSKPLPDDNKWRNILSEIERKINKEIKDKGKFIDSNTFGVYIGTK